MCWFGVSLCLLLGTCGLVAFGLVVSCLLLVVWFLLIVLYVCDGLMITCACCSCVLVCASWFVDWLLCGLFVGFPAWFDLLVL